MSASYHPATVRWLARCARLAYRLDARAATDAGLHQIQKLADAATDTQIFVADAQPPLRLERGEGRGEVSSIVVSFRGTTNVRDWLTNLRTHRITVAEGVRVHAGFHAATQAVWSPLVAELVKRGAARAPADLRTSNSGLRIWLTGHSLGGALAVLTAWSLRLAGFEVVGVVTFGAPRAGDAGFAARYTALLGNRTWRLVNQEDPVPRVLSCLRGWRHVGREVFFDHFGQRLLDPPLLWKLVSDTYGLRSGWGAARLALLPDHDLDQYVAHTARDTAC